MSPREPSEQDLSSPTPGPREIEAAETAARLAELLATLHFKETNEMREFRSPLVEAMAALNHTAIKELLSQYQTLGKAEVNQLQGEDFARGKIGLIIATALLWREAGQANSYANELYNARLYVANMHFDNVADVLRVAWEEVRGIFKESEESTYKGPPTEEIIAGCKKELPPELHEELDSLYALPPDEVLEEVAALMEGYEMEETPPDFFSRMGWTEN